MTIIQNQHVMGTQLQTVFLVSCYSFLHSLATMLANAVTKTIIQQTVQFVPSIPQFASGVLSKCVAFALPCIVSAFLHPSAVANPGATQDAFLAFRGGNEYKVDMERAGFRLSGIEQYCLISSILLGALTGTSMVPIFS
jgi:hypothetical protein